MKILVDARHLTEEKPTGIGQYLRSLITPLAKTAPKDQFIFWTSGKKVFSFPPNTLQINTNHYHSKRSNRLFTLRSAGPFRNSLEDAIPISCDVVFLPHIHAFPKIQKVPTVLVVHDLTWLLFPKLYSAKMRAWHKVIRAERAIREADYLIVPSKSTAADLAAMFPEKQNHISVVPHGLSTGFTSKKSPQDSGIKGKYHLPKRFALFVGTIEPRKNIWNILEGIKLYRQKTGNDLPLIIIGKWGWNTKHLKKILASMPNVRLLGYVEQKEQSAIYRMATVLIWPSIYEGFGLPPLEAMASGCPVITSSISSLPEVVGEAGVLVNPFNTNDLATALTFLMSDPILYSKYRARGLEQAKQFSLQKAAEQTYEVLKKIA